MNHGPHPRLASADDFIAGQQRSQPMGQVDQLRAADAGEEILGSAGEAGYFVGENGAADQDVIVSRESGD